MPPRVKKVTTPVAPTGADKPSEDAVDATPKTTSVKTASGVEFATKKAKSPGRTSVKTASGVEIGWV